MRWLDNRRVGLKLSGSLAIVVVGIVAITAIALWLERQQMLADREAKTRTVVEMIAGYSAALDREVASGSLTPEAARAKLVEVTHAQRYDGFNYINIYTDAGVAVASPSNTKLVGTNKIGLMDPNGVPIVATARDIARNKGSGFYHYMYAKPGETKLVPKLTFVQALTPNGSLFALSGIYIDDVDAALWRQGSLLGAALLTVVLLVSGMSVLVQRSVGGGLRRLCQATTRLAGNDLAVTVPGTGRGDEIGAMARAMQSFKDAAIDKKRLEADLQSHADQAAQQQRLVAAEREEATARQTDAVNALAQGLARLADGDLTWSISSVFAPGYEQVRLDFNNAVAKLREAMGIIVANTDAIRAEGHEIAASSDDLSRRTEQQAANLEQAAAALDEITATVTRAASGSAQAQSVMTAAQADAEKSKQVVQQAMTAMQQIEGSSHKISEIIGVIDEIAFQTNLLALNAGVEAARAGDAGRGFAVVASEVRALAQRSADAAREIKTLIQTSSRQVKSGVTLVTETGAALHGIVGKVAEVHAMIGEIAASAHEQATGLAEVNTAVNQMDQMTQQNAAMVEQSTAACHALSQQVNTLVQMSARFRLDQQGGGASSGVDTPAPASRAA